MSPSVWLVGMMGAGKSSVGPKLAARLGVRFHDSDLEIEREAGMSVAEIFAREGEEGFRAREREVVEALLGREAVVALGGGALSSPELCMRLEACGTVVYLRARPETLLARLGDAEARPLLAGRDPAARLERLRDLLARREGAYGRARLVVDTDTASVDEVVERLVVQLSEGGS